MLSRKSSFHIFVASIGLLSIVGCNNGDTGKRDVGVVPIEERIKAIEAREDMPPQAKAMAIQQLKAGEASSRQGSGGGPAAKK